MYEDQGAFVHFSEEVKKHVSIPVVTVGRIKNPIMADKIIMEGKADLVAMARAQIADPEMVENARRGELADIRLCLAECLGCIEGILRYGEASCAVNPRVGREYLIKDVEGEKRATAKKVLVAGAGCAGLEAARRAAFAGHKVILCESRGWIGGQLRLAAMMPKRQEIGDIIPWYERQLNKLGVEIRLNTPVDEDLLNQISPDVLVIAAGSLPEVPLGFIEGLNNIENIELIMVDELLEEEKLTGDNVLVVGGDQIGLQVADYLSERVKRVHVVEKGAHFAEKMAASDRFYLVGRVIGKGVKRYKRVLRIEILPTDEVWMVNGGGRERLPEIDTIVLASDRRPNIFLAEVAERKGIETHIIGDAKGVTGTDQATVSTAIAMGYDVGRQI
jgi:NADPH-dependent 2,4-dienoyl-CoA reductase/sulfur reductase-like enzyme